MPNPVKYSTTTPSGSLRKGNMAIGVNPNVAFGPTSTTGFYAGILSPSGGYTIYQNKLSQGPSIYIVNDDAQLITRTNTQVAGTVGSPTNFTTVAQCLNYYATQTDKIIINKNYPGIVTSGSILNLDAGFLPSYPTTASTWYDISGNNLSGSLFNGSTYNTNGAIVFDGVDDYVLVSNNPLLQPSSSITLSSVFQRNSGRTIISYSSDGGGAIKTYAFEQTTNFQSKIVTTVNGQITLSATNLSANTWYYVVMTYNGSINSLYINGSLITSSSASGNINYQANTNLNLGRKNSTDGEYINGKISTTQIYNRALTQAEINQNYYQAPIVTSGLVFAVDAGNLVSYESGSATIYSMTGSATGSLLNGTGYSSTGGGTWTFDGIDDSISTNPPAFSSATNSLSFNFWVYATGTSTSSQTILGRDTNLGAIPHILIRRNGNLNLTWNWSNGTSASNVTFTNFFLDNLNKWVNLQITANYTTGAIRVYRNGQPSNNATMSTPVFPNTSVPVYISGFTTAGFIPWTGNISTAQIYNIELTAAEVAQNYNAQKSRFL